ncbi:MAG: cupredoxin domain-containing protein [Thauera sp.]|nr:cupredoxin domain-containing protein [Thauera sp.]
MNTRIAPAGLFAAAIALAAAVPAQAAEHQVVVEKYAFSPMELRIKRGDTVTWVNNEKRVSHSVLMIGRNEESERFFSGESWSRAFPEAGRFEYRCGPHPEMLGVVIVAE